LTVELLLDTCTNSKENHLISGFVMHFCVLCYH